MPKPRMLWGEAIRIITGALDHHIAYLRQEADKKEGFDPEPLPDPPYLEQDIKRAWKRMLEG